MARLVHYFKDADMRCTHNGLTLMAKKKKLSPDALADGEFLLFVNKAQTMFKLLGSNNTMVHVRSERGRVDLRVLRYLPKQFSGQSFNYDAALKKVLEKDLSRHGRSNG